MFRFSKSRATVEVKQACAELVDDPAYRAKLRERLPAGTLPPGLECLLGYYAKGKPREEMNLEGKVEFSWLTRKRDA